VAPGLASMLVHRKVSLSSFPLKFVGGQILDDSQIVIECTSTASPTSRIPISDDSGTVADAQKSRSNSLVFVVDVVDAAFLPASEQLIDDRLF